ncbi:MAG TPA: aspartate aminotransferase family protein [Oculatellaceae cyanobacterium]
MSTQSLAETKEIDREHLQKAIETELGRFASEHPQSKKLFDQANECLLAGVPMNWMVRWAGNYPIFVKEAQGAHFRDVDGNNYIDLCLGDTGAMTGHAPAEAVYAISERLKQGTTFMLPTEDSIWVGKELSARFGLPLWQVAMTATDANRFSIRLARHITGRRKILVFNWCYHGTVDETFVNLVDGRTVPRKGNIGAPVDPSLTTKVVEFNNIEALAAALQDEDVACVLCEPVMTNIGIVHPQSGFHAELRRLTRKHGTLLIIDETHTICAGPGGYTREFQLEPDILTCGKPIASGIPAAVYGLSKEVAAKISQKTSVAESDTSGIGGTLAGNALSLAAMRTTLEHILTEDSYKKTIPLAKRFTDGVQSVIDAKKLPWSVQQLGCRAEYWFRKTPPKNGGEAAASIDGELDHYMHLFALNRGILMTPFHNMALMSPSTTEKDVDRHTEVFAEAVESLKL